MCFMKSRILFIVCFSSRKCSAFYFKEIIFGKDEGRPPGLDNEEEINERERCWSFCMIIFVLRVSNSLVVYE